jgi:hypothetical protein
MYGAPGKPFPERTQKDVVIFIEQVEVSKEAGFRPLIPELKDGLSRPIEARRRREVYHKHLKLEAGYLNSAIEWYGDTNVVIHLFEWIEPGPPNGQRIPISPKSAAETSLHFDPAKGRFEEVAVASCDN